MWTVAILADPEHTEGAVATSDQEIRCGQELCGRHLAPAGKVATSDQEIRCGQNDQQIAGCVYVHRRPV